MTQTINVTGTVFDGPAGESVFTTPFMHPGSGLEAGETSVRLYGKIEATGDDRSHVLTSALVVEYYINQFLRVWLPGYKLLEDNQDFTFSLRIALVRACRLIPPRILLAADAIRATRNAFAHDLELDTLEALPQKDKDRLLAADFIACYRSSDASKARSTREVFQQVVFIAASGIQAYIPNAAILRERMEDSSFIAELRELAHKRLIAWMQKTMEQPPTRVEVQGNVQIEHYGEGLRNVSVIKKRADRRAIALPKSAFQNPYYRRKV